MGTMKSGSGAGSIDHGAPPNLQPTVIPCKKMTEEK
jgi:hypothetical protein